ncbi:hypothetical protein LJB88_02120 [Erysipelotrichaceae bacterium OttesenSCG-928-M19]|nr:hypothetical protein [Erysipelotrichaceae bacterium OttesenSCG-928-M19]
MPIDYNPPKYTDNPDIIRDMIDLAEQLGSDALTSADKDDLLIQIQNAISQSNSYTDSAIDNSGMPLLKQVKENTSTNFLTSETINEVVGSQTTINRKNISSANEVDIDYDDRISDQVGTHAIVIGIEEVEFEEFIILETVSRFEIVNYGASDAFDVYTVFDDVPSGSAPTGSYALSLNYDNTVKLLKYSASWQEIAILKISLMSMFKLEKDSLSKYWFIDRWEEFKISFDVDNYVVKEDYNQFVVTTNQEINDLNETDDSLKLLIEELQAKLVPVTLWEGSAVSGSTIPLAQNVRDFKTIRVTVADQNGVIDCPVTQDCTRLQGKTSYGSGTVQRDDTVTLMINEDNYVTFISTRINHTASAVHSAVTTIPCLKIVGIY